MKENIPYIGIIFLNKNYRRIVILTSNTISGLQLVKVDEVPPKYEIN
jgi:hypothetical protein